MAEVTAEQRAELRRELDCAITCESQAPLTMRHTVRCAAGLRDALDAIDAQEGMMRGLQDRIMELTIERDRVIQANRVANDLLAQMESRALAAETRVAQYEAALDRIIHDIEGLDRAAVAVICTTEETLP